MKRDRVDIKPLPPTTEIDIRRVTPAGLCRDSDQVAVEEPLEIRLAYADTESGQPARLSLSITMRTPGHDIDLAIGFLFTESIIHAPEDVQCVEHAGPTVDGRPSAETQNVVQVDLAPSVAIDPLRLQRHFYTSSSCGVCGKTSLEALVVAGGSSIRDDEFRVSATVLHPLPEMLKRQQAMFRDTGGIHAAGAFDAQGRIVAVREDIGRHNAVDKLVGALLAERRLPCNDLGIVVSGRASFELMQKAVMAGFPLLAAVGAPSSLAVDLAREFNITLVGFLRDGRFNIYSGGDRITVHTG